MKVGLWKIYKDEKKFAQIEWILYKWFGIKRKYPCGRDKKEQHLCRSLNPTEENSIVINDGTTHEIRCKVCGHIHIVSSSFIKNVDEMWEF